MRGDYNMKHLRQWRTDDAADLASTISNKKVQDNLRDGFPDPYTRADAAAFITSVLDAPSGSQYVWAIQRDGKAVGSLGLHRMDNIHRLTAELGYYIDEQYWGKGIVAEAVREACDFAFRDTDIVRIFAEPFSRNVASCRVLEKVGFTHECTLRSNAIKNGEIIDMEMYALVKA